MTARAYLCLHLVPTATAVIVDDVRVTSEFPLAGFFAEGSPFWSMVTHADGADFHEASEIMHARVMREPWLAWARGKTR